MQVNNSLFSIVSQVLAANAPQKPKVDPTLKKESELQDLKFAVLERAAASDAIAAKDLSEEMDHSVFSISSMIKKLTRAGLLKFSHQTRINKSIRNFYVMTDKGFAELRKHQVTCAGKSSSEQGLLS